MIQLFFLVFLFITIIFALYKFRYGFFIFIVSYFVYPDVFALGIGSQGFALTMTRAQIIVLLSIVLLRFLFLKRELKILTEKIKCNSQSLIVLILFVIYGITISYIRVGAEITILSGLFDDFLRSIGVLVITLVAIRNEKDILNLAKIVFYALAFNSIFVFYELLTQQNIFHGVDFLYKSATNTETGFFQKSGVFRAKGLFSNPLHLAFNTILSLPLLTLLLQNSQNRFYKLIYLLVPISIFVTRSRSAIVLLILCTFYLFFKEKIYKYLNHKVVIKYFITFFLIISAITIFQYKGTIFTEVNQFITGEEASLATDRSAQARYNQLLVFSRVDLDKFVFGLGRYRYLPGVTDVIKGLDNLYVRIFLEFGALGLLLFLYYLFKQCNIAKKINKRIGIKNYSIYSDTVLSIFLFMFLIAFLSSSKQYYVYIFVASGITYFLNYRTKN